MKSLVALLDGRTDQGMETETIQGLSSASMGSDYNDANRGVFPALKTKFDVDNSDFLDGVDESEDYDNGRHRIARRESNPNAKTMFAMSARVAHYAKKSAKVVPLRVKSNMEEGIEDSVPVADMLMNSANNMVVCQCKLRICKMLKYISSLWVDLNVTCMMKTFRDQFTKDEELCQVDVTQAHKLLLQAGSLTSNHPQISRLRAFMMKQQRRREKAEYRHGEGGMLDRRSSVDAEVQDLLESSDGYYVGGEDGKWPEDWESLTNLDSLVGASQLDLLAISGADLTAILLDLTTYHQVLPELSEEAFSLLFKLCNPHNSVADALKNTQLLVSPEFLRIHMDCAPALEKLRQQVDLAEVRGLCSDIMGLIM